MAITASLVSELRAKTGVGMMKCKEVLTETDGDIEKAIVLLREKGLAAANKKSDREAKDGRVFTVVNGSKAVILELNCETDFVSSNDDFAVLGNQLAQAALDQGLGSKEALNAATVDGQVTTDLIAKYVLKIGENIQVGQAELVDASGSVADYIHSNGKIGVLVEFTGDVDAELGKDIAMQVAAAAPRYVKPEEVDPSELEQEKAIIMKQCEDEGKPAEIAEKIVAGRIKKFYKEVCLVEQAFIKDGDKTVQQTLPEGVTIATFKRYSLV